MYVDVSELRELAGDFDVRADAMYAEAEERITGTLFAIEARAKVDAPVDTGALEGSISTTIEGLGGEVGPTVDYGGFVELGVDHPYTIRAKDGGALHFTIGGKDVFVTSVVHPPSAPQPYLGPAFDTEIDGLPGDLLELGDL